MIRTFFSEYVNELVETRDVRFGSKVGQIVHKFTNPGSFPDQILVHFDSASQKRGGNFFRKDTITN